MQPCVQIYDTVIPLPIGDWPLDAQQQLARQLQRDIRAEEQILLHAEGYEFGGLDELEERMEEYVNKRIPELVTRFAPKPSLSYDEFAQWRYKQPRTATWGLYRDTTALDAWLHEKFPGALFFLIGSSEVRVFYKEVYRTAIDGEPPTCPMDKRLSILWDRMMEAYRRDDTSFFSFTSNEDDTEREYRMTWKQLAKFHNVVVRAYNRQQKEEKSNVQ